MTNSLTIYGLISVFAAFGLTWEGSRGLCQGCCPKPEPDGGPVESAPRILEAAMVEHNNEDDILARAIRDVGVAVSRVAEWETVGYETEFILDMPPGAAVELVHAVLPAMKHPLLPEQPVTVDEHGISWIADDGIGMNPVLITVNVSNESYGTALKVRGTATGKRSARMSVDAICGLLSDHFGKWDVIDVMDRYVTPSDPG